MVNLLVAGFYDNLIKTKEINEKKKSIKKVPNALTLKPFFMNNISEKVFLVKLKNDRFR